MSDETSRVAPPGNTPEVTIGDDPRSWAVIYLDRAIDEKSAAKAQKDLTIAQTMAMIAVADRMDDLTTELRRQDMRRR